MNIKGPGCLRHLWFLTTNNDHELILEINIDDSEKPQVVAPLRSFFGIMQDREPYFVDCAAFNVLPNPVATEKSLIDPQKIKIPGTPGYNLYLPIPFSTTYRITVRGTPGAFLGTVLDWHKYDKDTPR